MRESPKKYCSICKHLVAHSPDYRWCCKFGKPAKDAVGHCRNTNGRNIIASQT